MTTPRMTRAHFAFIAETLAHYTRLGEPLQPANVAHDFARSLASTNPAFNRERFLRACGVEG